MLQYFCFACVAVDNNEKNAHDNISENIHGSSENIHDVSENTEDPFEEFLSSQSSQLSQSSSSFTETISNILNDFKNIQRISYTKNIVQYWETQKDNFPELYKLASVVLAVPATQVKFILLYIICLSMIIFLG